MTSRRARLLGAASVLVSTLLLGGCALDASATGGDGPATPLLADVTPIADPKSYEGPSSARIAEKPVAPITDGAQTLPATVTDAQGTTVTVTDTSRILALDIYGTLSRVVFELGYGDQIVGRDVSSGFDEIADRTLVTQNGHDLNAEAILDLAPTLILTDTSLGPWDVVLQMRDAGIPVVVVDSKRSLDGVGALTGQVASALGVPERGTLLADRIDADVAEVRARIDAVAPSEPADKLRVAFLYVRGQAGIYYLFGEGSGADDLIRATGAIDVAKEIDWQGMRPVTDEGLVAAAPDAVLVMTKGLESVGGVDGLLEAIPALQQTPAGQHRRVIDMPDDQILSFGPNTAPVLEALAVAMYAPESTG